MRSLTGSIDSELEDDHDHDITTAEEKELLGLKIALIFIMVAIVYLGLIPAYSKRCRSNTTLLSLMNCFAGGLFLAMAFVHILPEAAE